MSSETRWPIRRGALRLLVLLPIGVAAGVAAGAGIHELAAAGTGGGSAVVAERPAPGPAATDRPEPRPGPEPGPQPALEGPSPARIDWRNSEAVGVPEAGRLRRGVALPAAGRFWVSWDPVLRRSPNRRWRRFGTDRLLRTTLAVMREFGAAHPGAPRVAIGDLSRPRGGEFGPRFGYIGHATHQNGLDVDVYYPRLDERPRPPESVDQVDVRLAQDLVDRFVAAGATTVYVGPNLPLTGPAGVVIPAANHDNHLHARLPDDD